MEEKVKVSFCVRVDVSLGVVLLLAESLFVNDLLVEDV